MDIRMFDVVIQHPRGPVFKGRYMGWANATMAMHAWNLASGYPVTIKEVLD